MFNLKNLTILLLSVIFLVLLYCVGLEVYELYKGELVAKNVIEVFSEVKWSFYPILILKNSALLFLLVFFIAEYKINQRQYFQYKFKKNVAYSLTSVEDRYKKEEFTNELSKMSLEIYKDIIYNEPQWGKKDIKKELPPKP